MNIGGGITASLLDLVNHTHTYIHTSSKRHSSRALYTWRMNRALLAGNSDCGKVIVARWQLTIGRFVAAVRTPLTRIKEPKPFSLSPCVACSVPAEAYLSLSLSIYVQDLASRRSVRSRKERKEENWLEEQQPLLLLPVQHW